jgi:type I restriction enzyme S subunit
LPNNWSIAPLNTICTTINGLWKGEKEPLINVGVIRNANFTKDFGLDYSKIEYINVEFRSFEKRNLEDGDIIVEKSGGSENFPVGRSIIFNGESRKYSFSNFTMSLRIIDKSMILPKYLYYVLQHKYRRGDMKQMQTQTTGLHNLLTEKFLSSLIPIPPVREQEMIVLVIENLFRTVDGICDLVKDSQ